MEFYGVDGSSLSAAAWAETFERYYYLDGPTYRRNITRRTQASPYVEGEVSRLLRKEEPLARSDLSLLMAWKIGLINHQASEVAKNVIYSASWSDGEKIVMVSATEKALIGWPSKWRA